MIVSPFPQAIETLVALVVLHVTDDERGVTPLIGVTVIELQEGVITGITCITAGSVLFAVRTS